MTKYIKFMLSGLLVTTLALLVGCSGSGGGSTSAAYYNGYHNPYPGWGYYGRRTVYVDHRPGHKPPGHRPPDVKPPGSRPPAVRPPIAKPPGSRPPSMGRPPGGHRPATRPARGRR